MPADNENRRARWGPKVAVPVPRRMRGCRTYGSVPHRAARGQAVSDVTFLPSTSQTTASGDQYHW